MKRNMIPAGALLLAMACGSSAPQEAKVPTEHTVDLDLEQPAPPPAMEPRHADLADNDASSSYLVTADVANGQVSANMRSDASTDRATYKDKPDPVRAFSSSAARAVNDTSFRFIRTADLEFRVRDVVDATLGIEDIVGAHDGWIVHTTLRSEAQGTEVIPVSADSSLEISRYTLINAITLRVPNAELDSTLRGIGRWVDLFDHRTIDAEDIKLNMLSNVLAERRARAHAARLAQAIDEQGKRLKETLPAEEALQAADEQRDKSVLDNLELQDRVAYSTVRLNIHQRPLVRKEMIANERNIEGYRPSLLSRIGDALASGWHLLEMVITGLIGIWPVVLLLGGAMFWLWRGRKRAKAVPMPPPPGAQ